MTFMSKLLKSSVFNKFIDFFEQCLKKIVDFLNNYIFVKKITSLSIRRYIVQISQFNNLTFKRFVFCYQFYANINKTFVTNN